MTAKAPPEGYEFIGAIDLAAGRDLEARLSVVVGTAERKKALDEFISANKCRLMTADELLGLPDQEEDEE